MARDAREDDAYHGGRTGRPGFPTKHEQNRRPDKVMCTYQELESWMRLFTLPCTGMCQRGEQNRLPREVNLPRVSWELRVPQPNGFGDPATGHTVVSG